MKEIDKRATNVLLAALDSEIDMKCMELKEQKRTEKLKKIFFLSCLLVVFLFVLQVFFKILNVNFLLVFILYQAFALTLITPLLFNLININRGGIYR